ncbi:hypothetical protein JXQ31_20230 [candidate division KSB1 bacterium]|nr:hypothetical protein [candidate division KSB1 bacterium]
MSKNTILILVGFVILALAGCAAHTNLQPVGKNNIDANLSIGGPVIKAFGARIPIPYATGGVNYGIRDNFDLNGNLHLLPAAYKLFGCDFGATWFPVLNNFSKPTIGLQARLLTMASLKADVDSRFRFYPSFSASSAWKMGGGLFYTGADITVPVTSPDYDDDAVSVIFSPFFGYRWNLGSHTRLLTEIKWNGANIQTHQLAVEYLPVANYGAITTLFSIERSFK